MRSRALAALLAATTLTLTACGGDDADPALDAAMGDAATGPPYDPAEPLDEDQLAEALVEPSDVGAGFTRRSGTSQESDAYGCVGRIDDLEQIGDPDGYREAVFFGPDKTVTVFVSVATFDETDGAASTAATWGTVQSKVEGCTRVREREKRFRLRLDAVTDTTLETDADEQVNLEAKGTQTWRKQTRPYVTAFSLVRIGNEIITVGSVGETADVFDLRTAVLTTMVERLHDLQPGES